MMDIYGLIRKYEKSKDFTYAKCNDNDIIKIEKMMNVKLPEDYIKYIKTFGGGGVGGIEIYGIGVTGRVIVVEETEHYRKYGMPKELVAIENCDEWVYCINTINGKVVMWYIDGFYRECYDNFQAFLTEQMNDIIENMIYSGEIQEDE